MLQAAGPPTPAKTRAAFTPRAALQPQSGQTNSCPEAGGLGITAPQPEHTPTTGVPRSTTVNTPHRQDDL
jgi:hypothetical protein